MLRYDSQAIDESDELPALVNATSPGKRVVVEILHNGHKQQLDVEIGSLEEASQTKGGALASVQQVEKIGITVFDVTADERQALASRRAAPWCETWMKDRRCRRVYALGMSFLHSTRRPSIKPDS
jgi:hypothetical protein